MDHPFCHIELMTDKVAKAQAFYGKLFGWKMQAMAMPAAGTGEHGSTYVTIQPGSGPGGGILQKPHADMPNAWHVYVNVANLKQSVAKAKKLGAKVLIAEQPVPGYGAFAALLDPTGAAVHLWQAEKKKTKKAKKAKKK